MDASDESQSGPLLQALEAEARGRVAQLDELLAEATRKLTALDEKVTSADVSATAAREKHDIATAALTELQSKASVIAAVATQALAAKTQIADDQAVIATKSDHIEQAQAHADKVRGDLDRALTAATQQVTEAEGLKSRAQSIADTAAGLLVEVKTLKATAETECAAATVARSSTEEAAEVSKDLADKSASIEERIGAYEAKLAALEAQSNAQLATIVGLLPGATSAGLAHAFDDRRQTFLKPSARWQWLFVGSVLSLVVLAASGLWHVYGASTAFSYDDLMRLWLARLPIAGALIWLALYAGRESALAKRLEEDYGYKSAIASTFLGFHKQMSEIGEKAGSNTPLAKLCTDTLATIASPPGRIYDKHRLVVSPGTELTEAARAVIPAGSNPRAAP